MYCLTVLEAGILKPRYQQCWSFLRVLREDQFQASLLPLWMACVALHHLPSMPAWLCIQISPFYKDTSPMGLGPTLMT